MVKLAVVLLVLILSLGSIATAGDVGDDGQSDAGSDDTDDSGGGDTDEFIKIILENNPL